MKFLYKRRNAIDLGENINSPVGNAAVGRAPAYTYERMGLMLDLLPIGLIIHQRQGILFSNQAACDIFRPSQKSLSGEHLKDFLDEAQSREVSFLLRRAFDSNKIIKKGHVHLKPNNGGSKILALTIARLPHEKTASVQILIQDITLQVGCKRQMENILATDSLTGSQNRGSFINYVDKLSAMRDIGSCGIFLLDIDFFRNINDTFGHQAGDDALRAVVVQTEKILARRTLIKRPDLPRPMLARFGGEEFMVVIPCSDIDETLAYADEIRSLVEATVIKTRRYEFSVTISIGVVMGMLDIDDIDQLITLTDKAIYAAKENGRNQIVCAQASMPIPPDQHRISRNAGRAPDGSKFH